MTHGTAYNVISVVAIAVLAFLLFIALFQPSLKYKITATTSESLNSPDFFRTLEALTDSKIEPHTGHAGTDVGSMAAKAGARHDGTDVAVEAHGTR